jgi:hypothetical protein
MAANETNLDRQIELFQNNHPSLNFSEEQRSYFTANTFTIEKVQQGAPAVIPIQATHSSNQDKMLTAINSINPTADDFGTTIDILQSSSGRELTVPAIKALSKDFDELTRTVGGNFAELVLFTPEGKLIKQGRFSTLKSIYVGENNVNNESSSTVAVDRRQQLNTLIHGSAMDGTANDSASRLHAFCPIMSSFNIFQINHLFTNIAHRVYVPSLSEDHMDEMFKYNALFNFNLLEDGNYITQEMMYEIDVLAGFQKLLYKVMQIIVDALELSKGTEFTGLAQQIRILETHGMLNQFALSCNVQTPLQGMLANRNKDVNIGCSAMLYFFNAFTSRMSRSAYSKISELYDFSFEPNAGVVAEYTRFKTLLIECKSVGLKNNKLHPALADNQAIANLFRASIEHAINDGSSFNGFGAESITYKELLGRLLNEAPESLAAISSIIKTFTDRLMLGSFGSGASVMSSSSSSSTTTTDERSQHHVKRRNDDSSPDRPADRSTDDGYWGSGSGKYSKTENDSVQPHYQNGKGRGKGKGKGKGWNNNNHYGKGKGWNNNNSFNQNQGHVIDDNYKRQANLVNQYCLAMKVNNFWHGRSNGVPYLRLNKFQDGVLSFKDWIVQSASDEVKQALEVVRKASLLFHQLPYNATCSQTLGPNESNSSTSSTFSNWGNNQQPQSQSWFDGQSPTQQLQLTQNPHSGSGSL